MKSLLLCIAGALAGIVALPSAAQTAIQPGTIVGTFHAGGYITDPPFFTVPAGKSARVTDIILTNYYSVPCSFNLYMGPNSFYGVVSNQSSLVISLNSGVGLVTGQTVDGGSTDPCPSNSPWMYVTVRGFYFTIP